MRGGLEPAQGGRGDLASGRFASPAGAQRGLRARMVRAAGGGGVPAHEAASSGGRGTWSPAARAGSPAPSCEGSMRDLRLAGTGANEPRVPGCEQIKNVKKCPASAPGVCTLLLVISPLTR